MPSHYETAELNDGETHTSCRYHHLNLKPSVLFPVFVFYPIKAG